LQNARELNEKKKKKRKRVYVCERVFIISREYFYAFFLLLDYAMRTDEDNVTGIEGKWRV
jgi:hypothetical protein